MTRRKPQPKRYPDRGGRFTDVAGPLLPLFADPDGRGQRRWKEVFGIERRRPSLLGQIFLAREIDLSNLVGDDSQM